MKCNISAWCRQTLTDHAKKRIAGFGLLCTLLLAGILSSCTDDEFLEARMSAMQTRSDCNRYITDAAITEAIDEQGGISISGISSGAANIINDNHDDYATCVGILDLVKSEPLVALTTHNKIPTGNGMRVGFEVQALTGLLDLSVLDAYEIKVYNGNTPVESSGPEGHTVNVGILNFDNSRVRLSVNIGSGKQFDHIELWLKSVLGLANTQKIYNVFYESTNCPEEGVNDACMEVLTDTGHNLHIDKEHTKKTEILGLLEIPLELGDPENMLDGSLDTHATCEGLDVLSKITISLKFNEQPAKQPIGIVLSDGNGILNADILGGITLKVYQSDKDNETEIAEESDFKTVNVDLISKNGKTYLEIPGAKITKPYNRIELVCTSLLSLSSLNIGGVYIRVDSDGDGIPDCSEDVTSGDLTLAGGITHLCEGNADFIPVESTTLPGGTKLSLAWTNQENETTETTETADCTLSDDRKFLQVDDAASWGKEGRYYVDILQGEDTLWNHAEVYVHPKETTWEPQDNSTDWNTWENWTNGVPWDCSNVFIPANVEKYPVLSASGTEEYRCNNIHFAPGTELIGQSHLHYTQAFVDMNLSSGAYHLISAPLQDMVTGDMFVAQNVNDWESWRKTQSDNLSPNYFMPINGEKQGNDNNSAYKEQRRNPYIYQRFWNSAVRNETLTRSYNTTDKAITECTDWSRSFNAVETKYEVGQGFALKAGDKTNATPYHFHFPKSFSTYHYYGINGNSLKESSIARTEQQIGRLWTAEQINGLTLKRETTGTLYLFGNPFMAHINIKKFLAKNTGVTCVKIYQNGKYVDINNNNAADAAQIAPMQAVFLLTATAGTRLPITLSEDMLEQGNSSTRLTRRMANQVRLTATSNRHSASCVVVSSSSGNDKFNSREDVTLLVGSEEGSGVAVYTIADGKALSIQRMRSATRIPVGFYLKRTGNVSLAFDASDNIWSGWRLKDKQTGRSYPLKGRITLHNVSTGSGRFFLEKVQ